MTLLNGKLELHGVDVEALSWRVISASRFDLREHEREDLCTWLVEAIWQTSTAYDAGRGSFSAFAYSLARRRAIDWYRAERGCRQWKFKGGRVHERQLPEHISLDADDSVRDRLESTLAARSGHREDDRDSPLGGLLADGDRQRARDLELLGLSPPW